MLIKTKNTEILKNVFKYLKTFSTENKIVFNKESVDIFIIDKGNISMANVKLVATLFDEYKDCNGLEATLNIIDIADIIGKAKDTDSVQLSIPESNDRFEIKIIGIKSSKNFKLPIMEEEEKNTTFKELNFDFSEELPLEEFLEAIDSLSVLKDEESTIFRNDKSGFHIERVKDKVKSGSVKIPCVSELTLKGKYNSKFISNIASLKGVADKFKFEFSKDFPCQMVLSKTNSFLIKQIVAPRVDNDD